MKRRVEFSGSTVEDVRSFVVNARLDFKPFRRVIVTPAGTTIRDINRNEILFPGIAYGHELLPIVLKAAGASFDPKTVHEEPPNEEKRRELPCSARYAWGQDRIA